jgi:adenylosuccinate lyase
MGELWSERRKLELWLLVEKAVCEAWHRRGRIPDWAMTRIRGATCDLERMRAIERETDHDVIAFIQATGESVGEAARFVHLGLTSSDVVDTALAMQAAEAGRLLDAGLDGLIEVVGRQAVAYKGTLTVGRTHGVHAEPTTFGLKLAVWYDELRRQRRRLDLAREEIAVGKISGAVGTHAHVPPAMEEEVCGALGLGVEPASTQVVQRDRHAFFLAVLAGIGGTLEKIAVEVRHLQRTEVREAEEPFATGNQGSSAMPHKRNPHQSERVTGLARLLRGYAATAAENVALWHERDISHSSVERVVFPDACVVLDFMLAEVTELVDRLVVFPDRMRANLELTGGLIYSQRVLLALVERGMDRQAAYRLVQHHALAAWDGGLPFREALAADPEVASRLDEDALEALFDPQDQLRHVDDVFARLGLPAAEAAAAREAMLA